MDISKILIDLYKRTGDISNAAFTSDENGALTDMANGNFGYFEIVDPDGTHFYYMYSLDGISGDITFANFVDATNEGYFGNINSENPTLSYDNSNNAIEYQWGESSALFYVYSVDGTLMTNDAYIYQNGSCVNTHLVSQDHLSQTD